MGNEDEIDIVVSLRDALSRPAKKVEESLEDIEDAARDADREVEDLQRSIDDLGSASTTNSKKVRGLGKAAKDTAEGVDKLASETDNAADSTRESTEATTAGTKALKAYRDASGRLRDEKGRFVKVTDEYVESSKRENKWLAASRLKIRGLGLEMKKTIRGGRNFLTGYFGILGSIKQLIFSDMALALPQLLTIINTLGASIVALIGPLGLLASNIALIAPGIVALGLAVPTVMWAFKGIGGAVAVLGDATATAEQIEAALKNLGPNARAFARELVPVAKRFGTIQKSVQEAFLQPKTRAAIIDMADVLFPRLNNALQSTARHLSVSAQNMSAAFTSPRAQQALTDVLDRGATNAGLMGDAFWRLGEVFLYISEGAGPQLTRFLEFLNKKMSFLSKSMADNPDGIASYFERAGDTAAGFGEGIGHLFRGLRNLARAAKPLSDFLTGGMREGLKEWADWLGMDSTQLTLNKYFEDMIPNMRAIGALIGAIWDAFMDIGTSEFFADGIYALVDVIPYFTELIKALDEGLGPVFVELGEAFKLMTDNNPASIVDPLIWTFKALASVVGFIAPIFAAMPPEIKIALTWIAGFAAMGMNLLPVIMFLIGPMKILSGAIGLVGKAFKGIWNFLKKHIFPLLKSLLPQAAKTAGKGLLFMIPGIGAVVGILATLADSLVWAYNNIDWFRTAVDGAWNGIKEGAQVAVDKIVELWGGMVNGLTDFWHSHLKPVLDAIGGAFNWLWNEVAVPAGKGIGDAWGGMVNGIRDVYNATLKPVIDAVAGWFTWLYQDILKPTFDNISSLIGFAIDLWVWVWENKLKPMLDMWGQVIWTLWTNYISTTFTNISNAWGGLVNGWNDLWNGVLKPVIDAIGGAITALWLIHVQPKFTWIGNLFGGMVNGIRDFWNGVLKPVFDHIGAVISDLWNKYASPIFRWIGDAWGGMVNGIKDLWNGVLQPVLDAFRLFMVNRVVSDFERAVNFIGSAWGKIRKMFADPINWVITTVWNNGIVKMINDVAKTIGSSNTLTPMSIIALGDSNAKKGNSNGTGGHLTQGRRARGGPVEAGKPYIVGEFGKEMIFPDRSGYVATASQTEKILKAGKDLTPEQSQIAAGPSPRHAMAPMGDNLLSTAASSVGAGVDWLMNGIAQGARNLLNPLINQISGHLSQFGTFGKVAGQAMHWMADGVFGVTKKEEARMEAGGVSGARYSGPPPGGGTWIRPSRGPVTSRFGPRWGGVHAGIDVAGGGPTYATAPGVVVATGSNILTGRTGLGIGIHHGGSTFSYYGHNPVGGIKVRPGQSVKQGQHIGAQGATGNVTGVHVHYELHKGGWGRAVNPEGMGVFDTGGWLMPGQLAYNASKHPEPILNGDQFGWIKSIADSAERAYSVAPHTSVAPGVAVQSGGDTYYVTIKIEHVESDVDIEKAVQKGIEKAKRKEKERA